MTTSIQGMRTAIIGCGRMGKTRADAVRAAGADVTAVFDPLSDVARSVGGPSAQILDDPGDLDLDALDALFLCTPPSARGPLELACVEAGVPFFVEKPVGLGATQAEPVLEALGRRAETGAGLVTAVGYMNRYRASVQAVRKSLSEERFVGLAAVWVCGRYARDWWLDPARSGGPINEQTTHLVDLCRYLGGEIVEVAGAPCASLEGDGTTSGCALTLRFATGQLGTVLYSCEAKAKSIGLRVVTADGSSALEGWDLRADGVEPDADVFGAETQAFLAAARAKHSSGILIDFAEGVRTQRVVDAIQQALRSGERVGL